MKLRVAVMVALLTVVLVPVAASAGASKVDVCHARGNGDYHLINVSDRALRGHLGHGDGVPGGEVPGMQGFVFGEDCELVEEAGVPAGCYTNNIFSFLYDGIINTLAHSERTHGRPPTSRDADLGAG